MRDILKSAICGKHQADTGLRVEHVNDGAVVHRIVAVGQRYFLEKHLETFCRSADGVRLSGQSKVVRPEGTHVIAQHPRSIAIGVDGDKGNLSWTPKLRQVAKVEPCP